MTDQDGSITSFRATISTCRPASNNRLWRCPPSITRRSSLFSTRCIASGPSRASSNRGRRAPRSIPSGSTRASPHSPPTRAVPNYITFTSACGDGILKFPITEPGTLRARHRRNHGPADASRVLRGREHARRRKRGRHGRKAVHVPPCFRRRQFLLILSKTLEVRM